MIRALLISVLCIGCVTAPVDEPDEALCGPTEDSEQRWVRSKNASGSFLFWPQDAVTCIEVYDDTSLAVSPARSTAALQAAIERWNTALDSCDAPACLAYAGPRSVADGLTHNGDRANGHLVSYVNDTEEWDAYFFEYSTPMMGERPSDPVAMAIPWSTADGAIADADILVNLAYYEVSPNGGASALDLESVLVHELGHLLGFDHTTEVGSVMQRNLSPGVRQRNPSAGDRAGVCAAFKCE